MPDPTLDEIISEELEPAKPSEKRIAELFVERHGDEFRYVSAWGSWFRWTGTVWQQETTLLVGDNISKICKEISHEFNKPHEIRTMLKASTMRGAEQLAMRDRRVAATVEQWDADPWLLNTPSGTVDLKTGELRPHDPEDYITKITSTTPDASCPTSFWDDHLKQVFCNDDELVKYFYRMAGYCLTADVSEHALFFCYGDGSNGKGTTINTVQHIWGDYAATTPMEMFTYQRFGHGHPTELTTLHQVRLAVASETEQGKGWSEARLKLLTGGDPVKARKIGQDFFEFKPTHKLLFHGNYKPSLRSTGEAMRRRMNMVPFLATFSGEKKDTKMAEKLLKEAPGIFYKIIKGCLDWQQNGLQPPKAVTEATEKYMSEQDVLKDWFEECVTKGGKDDKAHTKRLYKSYSRWMQDCGLHPPTKITFSQELIGRSSEFGIKYEEKLIQERHPGDRYSSGPQGRGFSGIANVIIRLSPEELRAEAGIM